MCKTNSDDKVTKINIAITLRRKKKKKNFLGKEKLQFIFIIYIMYTQTVCATIYNIIYTVTMNAFCSGLIKISSNLYSWCAPSKFYYHALFRYFPTRFCFIWTACRQ